MTCHQKFIFENIERGHSSLLSHMIRTLGHMFYKGRLPFVYMLIRINYLYKYKNCSLQIKNQFG